MIPGTIPGKYLIIRFGIGLEKLLMCAITSEADEMICPHCKTKLKCIDSRMFGDRIRIRKYRCPKCGFEEITDETLPETERK
jgi:predicted RNA-binding Zn-ribbon protein involved in translation (DUF1610 family)